MHLPRTRAGDEEARLLADAAVYAQAKAQAAAKNSARRSAAKSAKRKPAAKPKIKTETKREPKRPRQQRSDKSAPDEERHQEYLESVRRQLAALMAQADLLRAIRSGSPEIPRTLDAIANSEPEGQMTSYSEPTAVQLRPMRAGTTEHTQWLSVSAQLIAHESVDVQRELELVTKFCHPKWADQKESCPNCK